MDLRPPIYRFGGQAFPHFEEMINRSITIFDHSGDNSASFDSAGNDAIAAEKLQRSECTLI